MAICSVPGRAVRVQLTNGTEPTGAAQPTRCITFAWRKVNSSGSIRARVSPLPPFMLTKSKSECEKANQRQPVRFKADLLYAPAGTACVWSECAGWTLPTSCWTLVRATSWGPLTCAFISISPKRRIQLLSGARGSPHGVAQEEMPGMFTKPSTTVSPACRSTVSSPAWVSQMGTAQGLCNIYVLTFCVQFSMLVKHANTSLNFHVHQRSCQNYPALTFETVLGDSKYSWLSQGIIMYLITSDTW